MSAPKFRVGDVVKPPGRHASKVAIVWASGICKLRNEESWLAETLTLLRRPVQVGDVLTAKPGMGAVGLHTIDADDDITSHKAVWHTFWTHADGTPIEPPDASGGAVNRAYGKEVLRAADADSVDARAFIAMRAERDELCAKLAAQADLLVPKDDEIRRLKAELLDAQRTIERLTRKVVRRG